MRIQRTGVDKRIRYDAHLKPKIPKPGECFMQTVFDMPPAPKGFVLAFVNFFPLSIAQLQTTTNTAVLQDLKRIKIPTNDTCEKSLYAQPKNVTPDVRLKSAYLLTRLHEIIVRRTGRFHEDRCGIDFTEIHQSFAKIEKNRLDCFVFQGYGALN